MEYIVKRILEPPYGCEERPDDYVARDKVIIADSEGQETTIDVADDELYQKDINEGDQIDIDQNGIIARL